MSTFWANVDVEWLDGRNETYRVGGYASRYEAVRVDGGVLTLWLGNSAYGPYENVAQYPDRRAALLEDPGGFLMDLEDQHHLDIDAVYSPGELYITLECRWCPWIAEIDTPVVLADVIQQGDEHMETCGRGR